MLGKGPFVRGSLCSVACASRACTGASRAGVDPRRRRSPLDTNPEGAAERRGNRHALELLALAPVSAVLFHPCLRCRLPMCNCVISFASCRIQCPCRGFECARRLYSRTVARRRAPTRAHRRHSCTALEANIHRRHVRCRHALLRCSDSCQQRFPIPLAFCHLPPLLSLREAPAMAALQSLARCDCALHQVCPVLPVPCSSVSPRLLSVRSAVLLLLLCSAGSVPMRHGVTDRRRREDSVPTGSIQQHSNARRTGNHGHRNKERGQEPNGQKQKRVVIARFA
jgi:hypothetical protein